MKKFMFAAMAALAITSCSQNEEIENQGGKTEIGFTTAVGKSSRVAPTTNDNFTKFMVYGYNTADANMAIGTALSSTPFMDAATATKTGETWGIDKGPFYWPMTDKIQFFAFSPTEKVTYAAPTTGYPTLDYTIQAGASQVDLLAVKAENQTKISAQAGVNLLFKHILTRINFSVQYMDANATYAVTEIKLTGVNDKGTYSYANGKWSATSGTTTYTYAGAYGGTADNGVVDCSTADNSLMLMPQTPPVGAKITVTYSAVANGATTFAGTKEIDLTVEWGTGKNIRYTLQLNSDAAEIGFIPKVENWSGEETGV